MRAILISCLLLAGCSNPLDWSNNVDRISDQTSPTDDNAPPINVIRKLTVKELVSADGLWLGLFQGPNGLPWHAVCLPEELESNYREDPIGTIYELLEIVETGSVYDARTAGGFAWALIDGFGGGTAAANFSVDEETRDFYRTRLPSWIEEVDSKLQNSRCGTVLGAEPLKTKYYLEY